MNKNKEKVLMLRSTPRKRCGSCVGCMATHCGKCVGCQDMKKFGGAGTRKRVCDKRQCQQLGNNDQAENSPSVKDGDNMPGRKSDTAQALRSAGMNTRSIRVGAKSQSNDTGEEVLTKELPKPAEDKNKERTMETNKAKEKAQGVLKSSSRLQAKSKSLDGISSKKNLEEKVITSVKKVTEIVHERAAKSDKKVANDPTVHSDIKDAGKSRTRAAQCDNKIAAKVNTSNVKHDKKVAEKVNLAVKSNVKDSGKSKTLAVQCDKTVVAKTSPIKNDKKVSEKDCVLKRDFKDMGKRKTPTLKDKTVAEKIDIAVLKNDTKVAKSKSPAVKNNKKTTEEKAKSQTVSNNRKISETAKTPVMNSEQKIVEKGKTAVVNGGNRVVQERSVTPAHRQAELPEIALESMTQSELKAFIPVMVQLATCREDVWQNRKLAKPVWWPHSVKWSTSMKDWQLEKLWLHSLQMVVRSCYRYLGQEKKLTHPTIPVNSLTLDTPEKQVGYLGQEKKLTHPANPVNSLTLDTPEKQSPVKVQNTDQISPVKTATFPRGLLFPFCAEIYICYFCEKEFLNKTKMRDHQKGCSERPPQLQQYRSITVVTEDNVHDDPPQMSPKRNVLQLYSPLSLRHFCSYMDLIPKQTAAKLRATRASMEIDCNLEEMETPTTPVTPMTPRTPKSLISQLSRDDSGAHSRKRLSYSCSIDKDQDAQVVECDSSDSDNEDNQSDVSSREKKEANLLSIPVSSLLGQRIKNYVHVESPVSVVDNMEDFCRTPMKNSFLEKLRKKASGYPCMYKPRRIANINKQNHTYKFTRDQSKEFMCKINTGLNMATLKKVKLTKPVRVVVEKMTRRQLRRWIPSYILDRQLKRLYKPCKTVTAAAKVGGQCEFPSGPTLLAPNIDKLLGLKRKSSPTVRSPVNTSLSIGNYISEEMEAEVTKQKLTLYRCLLYEMSVLKPTVVMTDLKDEKEAGEMFSKKQKLSDSIDKVESEGGVFVVKSSNFRNKIHATPCQKKSEDRKSQYRTLVSLLGPKDRTDTESQHEIHEAKDCDISSQMFSSFRPSMSRSNMDSPTLVDTPRAAVQSNFTKSVSPTDDSLSVISLSSDGESTNPNCCIACRNKCLRSPCRCGEESVLVKSPLTIEDAKIGNDSVLQPINIVVDDGYFTPSAIPSQDEVMYGIPSPVSTRSESPLPTLLTKDLTSPKAPTKMLDDVHGCSPVVPDSDLTDTPISVESAHKETLTEGAFLSRRLRSLRGTSRSKSLTPSSSPVKLDTVACSSLPNSPEKAVVLQAPRAFKSITTHSAKRQLLIGTVGNVKTRSMGQGVSDKTENVPFSVNAGSETEALRKSLSQPVVAEKVTCVKKSASDCDSPVRRSKRKASTHMSLDYEYGPSPSKMKKWQSESVAYS